METIKEEKKADLEQLLNSLIEKGWKPFNVDCAWTNAEVINKIREDWYIPEHSKIIFKTGTHWHVFDCNIRDLVSKSSGLWQFVCENGMIKTIGSEIEIKNLNEGYGVARDTDYQYRLIEASLKNEDELEQFLLDNIIVNE